MWHPECLRRDRLTEVEPTGMPLDGPTELEPWVVVQEGENGTQLSCWRLQGATVDALAIFTDADTAAAYANEHCLGTTQLLQLNQSKLVQVFLDSFKQGLQHAALNPTADGARQVFELRTVLKAAQASLRQSRNH